MGPLCLPGTLRPGIAGNPHCGLGFLSAPQSYLVSFFHSEGSEPWAILGCRTSGDPQGSLPAPAASALPCLQTQRGVRARACCESRGLGGCGCSSAGPQFLHVCSGVCEARDLLSCQAGKGEDLRSQCSWWGRGQPYHPGRSLSMQEGGWKVQASSPTRVDAACKTLSLSPSTTGSTTDSTGGAP